MFKQVGRRLSIFNKFKSYNLSKLNYGKFSFSDRINTSTLTKDLFESNLGLNKAPEKISYVKIIVKLV
jgi:hypothetical protein